MNRYGVSTFTPESRVAQRRYSGRREYTGYDRIQQAHHEECGYSGPALWHISDHWESFDCDCGELVVVYDGPDLDDETRDMPHVDEDRMDGEPEGFPRGIVA